MDGSSRISDHPQPLSRRRMVVPHNLSPMLSAEVSALKLFADETPDRPHGQRERAGRFGMASSAPAFTSHDRLIWPPPLSVRHSQSRRWSMQPHGFSVMVWQRTSTIHIEVKNVARPIGSPRGSHSRLCRISGRRVGLRKQAGDIWIGRPIHDDQGKRCG